MIRINLLKDSKPKKAGGLNLPSDLLKKVSIGAGSILGLIIVFVIVKAFIFGPKKGEDVEYLVRDAYDPSSHLSKDVIEETVRDEKRHGDQIDKRGILRIPYSDMSFVEQVNFENHFAKSVIDLLQRNVSSGVDFRGVSFSDYTYLKGNGRSDSKSQINSVLKNLRNDNVTFLPKPETSITKLKEGFSFKISSIYKPGLDSKAKFKIYKDDIPDYEDIDIIIKRIIDACEEGGLDIKNGPAKNSAEVKAGFRRLTYKVTCNGSYRSFASFVNKMYQQQIPCSVKSASLKAVKTGSLRMNLEIMITTKR